MTKDLLRFKWSISKGRNTYGYNICSLYINGKKMYATNGGGYDMMGTVFAQYVQGKYYNRLTTLTPNYGSMDDTKGFYGLSIMTPDHKRVHTYDATTNLYLDGACGFSAIKRIANEIGLTIERMEDDIYLVIDTK